MTHSLVLGADIGAGGADLTGGALELGVGAFAGAAFAGAPPIADLLVGGQAGGGVQGAVAGTACVVVVAYANPALTAAMTYRGCQGNTRH